MSEQDLAKEQADVNELAMKITSTCSSFWAEKGTTRWPVKSMASLLTVYSQIAAITEDPEDWIEKAHEFLNSPTCRIEMLVFRDKYIALKKEKERLRDQSNHT